MALAPIPTLDQLKADPGKALTLPPDVRRRLALDAITVAHLLAVVEGAVVAELPAPDHALRLDEAAPRLGIAVKTLAQWTREKPEWAACVVHRSRSKILLSAARFEAALRDSIAGSSTSIPVSGRRGARAPMAARFPLTGMGLRDGGS